MRILQVNLDKNHKIHHTGERNAEILASCCDVELELIKKRVL